ncbi:tyrosine-type recombinase/integrase [Bradyrhizobium sp. ma5]|uniref:tyrosine-type recombinase/integrase n=1 Tax=Bradyrhizobium sp. ma5 TaxID=3344828 RepID=UPI0035D437AC
MSGFRTPFPRLGSTPPASILSLAASLRVSSGLALHANADRDPARTRPPVRSRHTRLSRNATAKAWSDLQPNSGFHNLRHALASRLIDAGVDIVTLSGRLGHARPDITLRVYAHLFTNGDGNAAAINAALACELPIGCQFRGSFSSSPPLST